MLFIDEIHRFNKAQQDAFLPYVERGDVILIGATTENPSFEVISALLSRAQVYALRASHRSRDREPASAGVGGRGARSRLPRARWPSEELLEQIAIYSGGDARAAYNTLESAAAASNGRELSQQAVEDAIQRKVLLYDKSGEEHYNIISALHKSVRSSDPDAALYWLARMLEAGEDRLYIARRLIRMAIEDIGLADPARPGAGRGGHAGRALSGHSGGRPGAGAGCHLPVAGAEVGCRLPGPEPGAAGRCERRWPKPVPLHLRNPVTRAMKEWGYGEGYQHAHEFEDAITDMECLPPALAGKRFYFPTDRGLEKRIAERLEELRRARNRLE